MSEFISYLFAILVVGPLQAELSERLQGVPSTEIVQAGRACISEGGPELLRRAREDWAWAAANAIGVGVGVIDPLNLLAGHSGDCDRLLQAVSNRSGGEA
ncbi:hypothetical protein [Chelativorans sp.]|uniref:hypothetical protein n=1 Tax=Chelativorans sp. TaxID=2203393 RepID=UPI002811DF9C|nr:hypothetical protein [Chelativorans sp.]